jgi:beta-lactam-binding protein with PASTA domain
VSPEKTEPEASKTPPRPVCQVPRLKGHSLAAARRLLSVAHCVLGRVRGRHSGRAAQLVLSQSVAAGSTHPTGTSVAVTLGRRT